MAIVISHRLTSVLLTLGEEFVASAQAISLTDASEGEDVRGREGEGDMIACKACDQRLPLRERGVTCGVLGEEGLRFGLTTGDVVKAREKRDRLEGVVLGLTADMPSGDRGAGDVGVLLG